MPAQLAIQPGAAVCASWPARAAAFGFGNSISSSHRAPFSQVAGWGMCSRSRPQAFQYSTCCGIASIAAAFS
ncbi:hypothetical protein G6F22_022114 [Rhizopus arrhizus]|nr:hypothetical protein G6F22_022114 [Rhizopus arrhizus]